MLKPFQNERGLALLLVLLVITLLVAMVVEFDYRTRSDLRSAGNLRDGLQATYLAKSGVSAAQALLKDDKQRNPSRTDLTATWAIPMPPVPLGEGTASVRITDEASKFNLNNLGKQALPDQKKKAIQQAIELFRLAQIDTRIAESIVDAIADWVDADNEVTQPYGAEESYYQTLHKPYRSKNKPMDSLSELHLIKGMTDEIYQKISLYVTVASNGQVNVNTTDPIVLQALGFDESAVKKLIERRPIKSPGDLLNLFKGEEAANVYIKNQSLLATKSDIFSVEAQGRAHDTVKTVRALLDRSSGMVRIKAWRLE